MTWNQRIPVDTAVTAEELSLRWVALERLPAGGGSLFNAFLCILAYSLYNMYKPQNITIMLLYFTKKGALFSIAFLARFTET